MAESSDSGDSLWAWAPAAVNKASMTASSTASAVPILCRDMRNQPLIRQIRWESAELAWNNGARGAVSSTMLGGGRGRSWTFVDRNGRSTVR
ncbi:hypothetical protein GCM10010195_65560 [Kitasatospora griseola]|nr:hypothetical protein GCM10010195_65560 [Kitasatospora griseola]